MNIPNFLVKSDNDFSLNEHVEVHSDVRKNIYAVQCSNGTIVRTHNTNQIFDVALDAKNVSSDDAVITGVPNQVLRKRFLCGELVECYLEQSGWTLAYVLRHYPNAVSIPNGAFKDLSVRCSISAYEVYVNNTNKTLQSQKIRAPSYHIRKFIGHPCEKIFPNFGAMLAAKEIGTTRPFAVSTNHEHSFATASNLDTARHVRLSKEDQQREISHFLDEFRGHLVEGDMVEVAVLEGVPSRKNFFRRAICAHVPG